MVPSSQYVGIEQAMHRCKKENGEKGEADTHSEGTTTDFVFRLSSFDLLLVGMSRLELLTSRSRTVRSTN